MGKGAKYEMVKNLNKHVDNYKGVKASVEEHFLTKATTELAKNISINKDVLQLGLGNGVIAKALDSIVKMQIIVEGSSKIIKDFSFIGKNTNFVESYFEDFDTTEKFDLILANHVMEHVDDPVSLLHSMKKKLKPNGEMLITVPNANSIHRLIGVEMGLLNNKFDLNTSDINAGHQRVYDYDKLIEDVCSSGLNVTKSGGYNIKLVSLAQMKDWSQELLDAIFLVSKKMPKEICSNIWLLCKEK